MGVLIEEIKMETWLCPTMCDVRVHSGNYIFELRIWEIKATNIQESYRVCLFYELVHILNHSNEIYVWERNHPGMWKNHIETWSSDKLKHDVHQLRSKVCQTHDIVVRNICEIGVCVFVCVCSESGPSCNEFACCVNSHSVMCFARKLFSTMSWTCDLFYVFYIWDVRLRWSQWKSMCEGLFF
jgi:hypothetical protein